LSRLDEISALLDELGIKYEWVNDEKLLMIWETGKIRDLKVQILAPEGSVWMYVVAPFKMPEMSVEEKNELYFKLLRENWDRNGVKFSIDEDGDIMVSAEVADFDLEADELQRHINIVLSASDWLWDQI